MDLFLASGYWAWNPACRLGSSVSWLPWMSAFVWPYCGHGGGGLGPAGKLDWSGSHSGLRTPQGSRVSPLDHMLLIFSPSLGNAVEPLIFVGQVCRAKGTQHQMEPCWAMSACVCVCACACACACGVFWVNPTLFPSISTNSMRTLLF